MNYNTLTLDDLKKGYRYDSRQESYVCNYCEKEFQVGQIFPIDGSFYEAERAVSKHLDGSHGGNFTQLLHLDSRYNTLTKNQKDLLSYFQSGLSDKEIAKTLGIAEATIRRQRFTFREKAKQARLYLAIYDEVFENASPIDNDILPVHDNAPRIDDRFLIREKERQYVLNTNFSSLTPLVLKTFSRKEKKKVIILREIAQQFQSGRDYTEKEVNGVLKAIYEDYVTIRRYLVEYGFLKRTRDGSKYWKTE